MKNQIWKWGISAVLISGAFYACQKELSNTSVPTTPTTTIGSNQQQVSIYLGDDPAFFDKVMIDLQKVEAYVDTCATSDDNGPDNDDICKAWINLNLSAGVYDLLKLRNGVDTLLANATIPKGSVKRLRLTLGTNNSLVKDGVTYPLKLYPGTSNVVVLKLKGEDWDNYSDRRRRIWLDFDLGRSIVVERNGEFYLRPLLRPFVVSKTGSIEGRILPDSAKAILSIYAGTDTAYALPNPDGKFKIRGLKAGTYTMFINASAPYLDSTVTGLTIMNGKPLQLSDIKLRK